jgi:hypothetical protein
MNRVFFITHPEVVVDPLIPVPQWKLSAPRGVRTPAGRSTWAPAQVARLLAA